MRALNNTTAESSALHIEIVDMLYGNNRRSLLAAFIVMAALLLVQRHLIASPILLIWSVLFLLAYGARAFLTYQYAKDPVREAHTRQWLQWFRATSLFCGIAWGLAGILLFSRERYRTSGLFNLCAGGGLRGRHRHLFGGYHDE